MPHVATYTGPWIASITWRMVTSRGSTHRRMPPRAPRVLSMMPAATRSCWMERANEYGMPFFSAAARTDTTPSLLTSSASMRSE